MFAYDAAFADIKDHEGFSAEAELARDLGFIGKSCIHPSQIALANAVFRPSDDEMAHAQRVVDAARPRQTQKGSAPTSSTARWSMRRSSRAREAVAGASAPG